MMPNSQVNCAALARVRELLGGENSPLCDSASLRLEKYVRIGGNSKREEVDAVVGKTPQRIPEFVPKGAITFTAKLGGRLIVNQAGGILENAGLCLHPHFNAPYIPGSALKGIARHAAWCAWNEEADLSKKNALAEEMAEIFGYPTSDPSLDANLRALGFDSARAGHVCFMPAYPERMAKLVTDIVNCHHPKYYSGDEMYPDAPDNESPIPNFFPAVESGVEFVFVVHPLRGAEDLALKAKHWLVTALTENGVGAKTAAGYGWFEYDEAAEEAARQKREALKAKAEAEKVRAEEEARAAVAAAAKAEARAKMTLLEKWQELNKKAVCNGSQIKGFARLPEAVKVEIVKILQMPEGIGHEVWAALNHDKKLKNIAVAEAIRGFCKRHRDASGNRDLGEMPK